jgi:hypothetical protein
MNWSGGISFSVGKFTFSMVHLPQLTASHKILPVNVNAAASSTLKTIHAILPRSSNCKACKDSSTLNAQVKFLSMG